MEVTGDRELAFYPGTVVVWLFQDSNITPRPVPEPPRSEFTVKLYLPPEEQFPRSFALTTMAVVSLSMPQSFKIEESRYWLVLRTSSPLMQVKDQQQWSTARLVMEGPS